MSILNATRQNRWWNGAYGRRRIATGQPRRADVHFYWERQQAELGYSQAVRVGDTVWLSGTASLDRDFVPVHPDDLAAQMAFVYARIRETLAGFSLGFGNVVRETMYVTDMTALVAALPYRKSVYGAGPFPASTTVQVSQLIMPSLMIEIEVTAAG